MITVVAVEGILGIVLKYGIWSIPLLFLLHFLFYPDKAEKVSSLLWKALRFVYKGAERKYITHDVQGRVNDFVNNYLSKEISGFEPINIKLEWVNENQNQGTFRQQNKFIVRMKQSENQNDNLVNASMLFISKNVLVKAKRYISQRQRESIDLFIGKKLFEREKDEIVVQFIDNFLQRGNDDQKTALLIEKYNNIDRSGLFFPIFVQEMIFLREKVFASSYDQGKVVEEVSGLIDFLNKYSLRKLHETIETEFAGTYCKFGIMIVGDSFKLQEKGVHPYASYIESLIQKGMESVYIIGNTRKKDFIKTVCSVQLLTKHGLFVFGNKHYVAIIRDSQDRPIKAETYLTIVRKQQIEHYVA